MKLNAIPNRTFWLMLGWLVVVMPADGFYDPSLGRWLNRDPIDEAGGVNLYAFVENNPVTRGDFFGLAAVGAPPRFDPKNPNWNNDRENCYTYACNRPDPKRDPRKDPTKGQPGGKPCGGDCIKVMDGVKKDFPSWTEVPPDGRCPPGFHKIHARTGANIAGQPDFHFYREDDDGGWSHKRGWTGEPERTDGSGKPITDPETANHDYGKAKPRGGNYHKSCGTLCIPN